MDFRTGMILPYYYNAGVGYDMENGAGFGSYYNTSENGIYNFPNTLDNQVNFEAKTAFL